MPVLLSKEDSKIAGEVLYSIVNDTGLTRSTPGSKARTLSEALGRVGGRLYKRLDQNLLQSFISGARGRYLDFIGNMLNTPRLGQETARTTAAQQIVKFYVNLGTFGTINGGSSILIASGTIISTGMNSQGILYRVLYDTVLPSDSSETYIAVESMQTGSGQNVGTGRLIYHNFSNYTDVLNNSLRVTNEAEISSAQDVEIDDNYRYRLSNAVIGQQQANQTAIRLAALQVPGVADVILVPHIRGLATFDIIIESVTPNTNAALLNAVSASVNDVVANGSSFDVKAPDETGIAAELTLTLSSALNTNEKNLIKRAVQRNVSDYINNLDIGEDLIINEIVKIVLGTDERISDMGVPNKPIDKLYMYKTSRLQDSKTRSELIANYSPSAYERVIIETTEVTGDPISITFA